MLIFFSTSIPFPGVCYMYVKELEPAKEYLSKTLNFHKNEQSFMTLGKILLLQGDINGAIGKCLLFMYVLCTSVLYTGPALEGRRGRLPSTYLLRIYKVNVPNLGIFKKK